MNLLITKSCRRAIYCLCVIFLATFFTIRNYNVFLLFAVLLSILNWTQNCYLSHVIVRTVKINRYMFPLIILGFHAIVITLVNGQYKKLETVFLQITWFSICYCAVPNEEDSIYKLIRYFKLILFVFGIFGLIEYYMSVDIWSILGITRKSYGYKIGYNRITSIFYNPLIYAIFIQGGVWAELFIPEKKTLHYFILLILMLNLIFTFCRSSWLIVVILFGWYFFVREDRKVTKNEIIPSLMIVIITIIVLWINKNYVLSIYQIIKERLMMTSSNDNSFVQRIGAIRNIIKYENEHPLTFLLGNGRGFAQDFMKNHYIFNGFDAVDNNYFSFLLEFGFIGICLLLSSVIQVMKMSFHCNSQIIKWALWGLIYFMVSILFYDGLSWYSAISFFALSMGVAIKSTK